MSIATDTAPRRPLVLEGVNTHTRSTRALRDFIYHRDEEGLKQFITERSERHAFREALQLRDSLEQELITLKKGRATARGTAAPVTYPLTGGPSASSLRSKEVQTELSEVKKTLNAYRGLTAKAARTAAELRQAREVEEGAFELFSERAFGDLVAGGEYEAGSMAWHQYRMDGIGGSDISKILTFRNSHEESPASYRTLFDKKVHRIAKPVDEWMRNNTTTAVGRGNSWEEYIRYMTADMHPELHVAFCKTSWEGRDKAYRRANFDGLILDASGTPTGILEVKTGSDRSKWGDVSEGLAGVPLDYKYQVLWYAANGKLRYGKIAVLLDDWEYREYDFDMKSPEVQAEVADIFTQTDAFWGRVQAARTALLDGI